MPINRVEVDEYECVLCGYKWINRVNGKDGPIPKRCAKCKHQHWEKGHIDPLEQSWRDAVKQRFGYFYYHHSGMSNGGWRIERNAARYLERRPSINEIKILLHPMSYLHTFDPSIRKQKFRSGCVPASDGKHVDIERTKKAHQYERELSRQLLKDLMAERRIPYDEREERMQL